MIDMTWFLYNKNWIKTIHTSTKTEYSETRMQIEAKQIFGLVVGNNRTFDQKVVLLRILISDDGLK